MSDCDESRAPTHVATLRIPFVLALCLLALSSYTLVAQATRSEPGGKEQLLSVKIAAPTRASVQWISSEPFGELYDWALAGDIIATRAKEEGRQGVRLVGLPGSHAQTVRRFVPIEDPRHLTFENVNTLLVLSESRNVIKVNVSTEDITTLAQLPRAVCYAHAQDGSLWTYGFDGDAEHTKPAMFRFDPQKRQVTTLGEGWYPCLFDNALCFLSDAMGTLECRPWADADAKPTILGSDIFTPRPVKESRTLVVQRGLDASRIELLDHKGRVIRPLSPLGVEAKYPRLSASERFVAYAVVHENPLAELSIHVVDLKGGRLVTVEPIRAGITNALSWSASRDRLAVVAADGQGMEMLAIIDFEAPCCSSSPTVGLSLGY